jgi:hypothetical protein
LLEDGRLFRIVFEGLRTPGVALAGWETSGAYVVARPQPTGWTLEPQPASSGLEDLDAPALMLAAELVVADVISDSGSEA